MNACFGEKLGGNLMARGNIDEQLALIDAKIEKATLRVKELKEKRQELLERKDSMAMQEVYDILHERGISPSEAANILRNHNNG